MMHVKRLAACVTMGKNLELQLNKQKWIPNVVLQLVLGVMQSHRSSLPVQVMSTACVFNLTTQDLAEAMPLSLLGAAVAQLLYAMKTFPNQQQVLSPDAALLFLVAPILPPSGSFYPLTPCAS